MDRGHCEGESVGCACVYGGCAGEELLKCGLGDADSGWWCSMCCMGSNAGMRSEGERGPWGGEGMDG
jgi:hypothetical protein